MLENRQNMDDDRIGQLEVDLRESQGLAAEADRKYDEVNFKFIYLFAILFICLTVHSFIHLFIHSFVD